ncbi:hypothetical protein B9N43_13450 [Denitratisoma sp. DHT3]|uniref:carboxymuconolactone decarboxylase family protein n=1 Tax=Denitratisoma sp. DHT3 TaxID=1981880 RepID=UPI001198BF42|nr:hypothetical protein [Denitratisoma sp. DHT3]QDX82160.1 hypothetical protein B9N43_13450 [Denitratisoma sp. DHT3]
MHTSPTSLDLAPALAPAGATADALEDLWQALWAQPHVPAPVLELCRLRLAGLHGLAEETALRHPAARLPEGKIAALLDGSFPRHPDFSPAERAALDFAEIYFQDAKAISDELAAEVSRYFGEPGLVALLTALGHIDGRLRLARFFSHL